MLVLSCLTACSPTQQLWFHLWWQHTFTIPAELQPVANCIKGVESGNYTESSHPSEGSGAYQFIPTTWQTWQSRWAEATGYRGTMYKYAFEAPSGVQDGVLAYTLQNGGASNWSGVDGCTGH